MSSETVSTMQHVVILGNNYVGKQSLMNRFIRNKFGQTSMPVGLKFESKVVSISGKKHSLCFWTVAGMCNGFKRDRVRLYPGTKAALLCYDASNLDSFSGVKIGLSELREHAPDCKLLYLCATKRDLVDESKLEHVVDMVISDVDAELSRMKFFVTSSKTGENVDGMFMEIIRDVCRNKMGLMVFEDVVEKEIVTDSPNENVEESWCRIS